jgi:hypothetical protein
MSNTSNKLTVFLDSIGRTIIGRSSSEDESVLSVENPALVHIQPNSQTNQLQLQILPLFFKEFQDNKSTPTVWNYKKANIVIADEINFAHQFVAQYEQLFQPPQPQGEPKVVKLFDE